MDIDRSRSALVVAAFAIAALVATVCIFMMRSEVVPAPAAPKAAALPATPPRGAVPMDGAANASRPASQRIHSPASRGNSMRLFGRVTDAADGGPVAGARILSFGSPFAATTPDPDVIATSQADGTFEAFVDRHAGFVRLAADVAGYERAAGWYSEEYVRNEDPNQREVLFSLVRGGGTISGVVVDESAVPIAGGIVGTSWLRYVGAERDERGAWCSVAATDAQGRFVLDGLPPTRSFVLPVHAEGFQKSESGEVAVGSETTIVLRRGEASVVGSVFTHDGKGVASVQVRIFPVDGRERTRAESIASRLDVLTDASGAFAFPDVPAGTYEIRAAIQSGACRNLEGFCAEIKLSPGETLGVPFRLPAPVAITGRVYDVATGKGVAGALLSNRGIAQFRMWGMQSDPPATTRSGADGSYRLDAIPRGDGYAEIKYELPEGWVAESEPYGNRTLTVEVGAQQQADLPVVRGTMLRGAVVRLDGTLPAAKMNVGIRSESATKGQEAYATSASTAADGTFSAQVPFGRTFALWAQDDRSFAKGDAVVPESGALDPVTLVLIDYATVVGRVAIEGKPLEGMFVQAGSDLEGSIHSSATTDVEGHYEMAEVKPGEHLIELSGRNTFQRNLLMPEPVAVTLAPGEHKVLDFEIAWGAVVEGVVTDEDGSPIEAANVNLVLADESGRPHGYAHATTDAEGYYSIGGLAEDQRLHEMTASAKGHFTDKVRVDSVAESPVNFALKASPPIPLFVYAGSPATPVKHYRCIVTNTGVSWSRVVDSADGRTTIDGIPEGTHRLVVCEILDVEATVDGSPAASGGVLGGDPFAAPGGDPFAASGGDPFGAGPFVGAVGRCATVSFSVRAGVPPEPIVVDLGAGVRVAGRAVTEYGDPVASVYVGLHSPNAALRALSQSSAPIYAAATDAAGAFSFPAVTPGPYKLAVFNSTVLATRAIDVPAGGLDSLEIVVPSFGSIDVLVRTGGNGQYSTANGIAYIIAFEVQTAAAPQEAVKEGILVFGEHSRARIDGIPFHAAVVIVVTMPDGRTGTESFTLDAEWPMREVVVDLRTDVALSGTVRIGGAPWTGKPQLALDGNDFESLGAGRYAASVPSGTACLSTVGKHAVAVDSVDVPEGVATFEHDFDLSLHSPSAIAVGADDMPVPPGTIELASLATGERCRASARDVTRRDGSVPFEAIPAGQYVATYTSDDRQWEGSSGPVAIGPGADDAIVVRIRRREGPVRIGTWDTSKMLPGVNTLSFDIAGVVPANARATAILFEHATGEGSVEFTRVEVSSSKGRLTRMFSVHSLPTDVTETPSASVGDSVPDCTRDGRLAIDAVPGPGVSTRTVYLLVN